MSLKVVAFALLTWAGLVAAQSSSAYCDSASGICFQGYTDPSLDMTIGLVLPPATTPPSDELIIQLVAPASYGWSGLSLGGQMSDSLLFTLWPYDGEVILGPRWTDAYVLPQVYTGPTLTLLPGSGVNSTHITATFRCQNCTVWEEGSLGSGNLSGEQVLAYVASTVTPVDDPADVASSFQEHNEFDFFGCNLASAQSPSYTSYISGASATSAPAPPPTTVPSSTPSSTPVHSSTSSAPAATQTVYGQCGGNGWTGPTVCASGSTCVAVSAPYYSQCQP